MGCLSVIADLVKLAAAAPAIINAVRGRPFHLQTPFVVVPAADLHANVPSPIRVTPQRIERGVETEAFAGVTIILGTSGVGKTREATDLVARLSAVSGAGSVYLAKGYVDSLVPLPSPEDVRRVVLFLDDYDWGYAAAASDFFLERQAAWGNAVSQLKHL